MAPSGELLDDVVIASSPRNATSQEGDECSISQDTVVVSNLHEIDLNQDDEIGVPVRPLQRVKLPGLKGPEDDADGVESSAAKPTHSYRVELAALFEYYEPFRLPMVDQLLLEYEGRELEFIEYLRAKYTGDGTVFITPSDFGVGTDPRANDRRRRSITEMLMTPATAITKKIGRLRSIRKSLSKSFSRRTSSPDNRQRTGSGGGSKSSTGDDSELVVKNLDTGEVISMDDVNTIVVQARESIRFRPQSLKQKLIVFFQQYDPAQVPKIDDMLRFGGMTEKALWDSLQKKYGVNQRERLRGLLLRFEPSKAKLVDKILAEFVGQEEDLINFYETKHARKMNKQTMKAESDDSTWKPGQPNTYQLLPSHDLGD